MSRRKTLLFMLAVLTSLLVMPVINVLSASPGTIRWQDREFLYNIDLAVGWTAKVLSAIGISLHPSKVVVGRDGWLFLGDHYEATRSTTRRTPAKGDVEHGERLNAMLADWNAHFGRHGVRLVRLVMAPNKESVYVDYLPQWAAPPVPSSTDAVLRAASSPLLLDLREEFMRARQQTSPLYFKTDTHWNLAGVAVAFRAIAESLGEQLPDLKWPDERSYQIGQVRPRNGGDLSDFLHFSLLVGDVNPLIGALDKPIETEQFDYATGSLIRRGGNPMVGSPRSPLLVKSKGALNDIRVLWLRDSFGTAMAPMMALTFSQTVQLHWSEAIQPDGLLEKLVEEWKPDIVLIVAVERVVIRKRFADFPLYSERGAETGALAAAR